MHWMRQFCCAGLVAAGCLAAPNGAAADSARSAALARNVLRAESIRDAKQLQFELAHAIEAGAWDEAAALFTADGEWREGQRQATGTQAIEAMLRDIYGAGVDGRPPRRIHAVLFMMPVATLSPDGQSVRIRWHGIALIGGLGIGAQWRGGIYENVYVRVDEGWKLSRLDYEPFMEGDYREGWHNPGGARPIYPYHYQAGQMGRTALLDAAVPGERASGPGEASVDAALVSRIAALEDEVALRNLQNAYGYYLDRRLFDDVIDLFEADGRLTIDALGSYHGPEGIRRYLERDGGAGLRYGEMYDHLQANLQVAIDADGRHARGRGMVLGMTGRNEGTAHWSLTAFDNRYVKRDGLWRIAEVRLQTRMRTPQALGWGRQWVEETLPAGHEPDRPVDTEWPASWPHARPVPGRAVRRMSFDEAEAALWRTASYDAIENLAGAYADYLDGRQWHQLASIFAVDGERDSAGGGFIRGPARIESFSRERYGAYSPERRFYSLHIRTQAVIHVAAGGRTAQARTRLFQTVIGERDRPPGKYETGMLMTGMYEDDLRVEDGVWRFKRVDIDHMLYTLDYAHGWTRIPEGTGKLMSPPLSDEVHFDAPGAGDPYPLFPKVGNMWFHYKNPVSGREPPLLMPKRERTETP